MKFIRRYLLLILLLLNIFVWALVYGRQDRDTLRVYFLDVGQGDAIFVDSPTHGRLLVDGGKNRQVVSELGKVMPFGDRRIDVVLATHPDADHIGGLPEVVSRYDVATFIHTGVQSDNTLDDELERRIVDEKSEVVIARRGMRVNFGDGVVLEILFPNQSVANWETNRASIVAKLVYGEKSFLLTGDSPIDIERVLLNPDFRDRENLDVDVLKAGHHGSRTSTSLPFAEATSPEYAVISAGRDNSYGHPHKEVIDILNKVGSKILNTADLGTIKFETDGKNLILN